VRGRPGSVPTGGRAREWLGKLVLLAASLLLVLGGLELLARWQLARPVRGKGFGGAYIRFHPLLGWDKTPGVEDEYDRDEFHVRVRINSRGLRDVERDYPARGAFRLLALGDSFVEAYTVDLEQTVTRQLEARLSRSDCPVEVVNGATSGYGTDQEWLFFREEGRRYEPRLVLLFFFCNDLDSNLRVHYFGAAKPLLALGEQGLQPVNTPLRPRPAREPADQAAQPAQTTEASEAPVPGWALRTWVQRRLLRGAPRAYGRLAEWGFWPRMRAVQASKVDRVHFVPPGPHVTKAWQHTERILAALRDDVASSGARLALVYVPNRFEVRQRDWDLTRAGYKVEGARWQRDAVRSRLVQAAARLALPLLDLTPSLARAESWVWGSTYLDRDGHWTRRGHAVAADALAGWLRAQAWLPACSAGSR